MTQVAHAFTGVSPAIVRLGKLAPLGRAEIEALEAEVANSFRLPGRAELLHEGRAVGRARLMLSGWAARVRYLEDGRRQIMSFVLPGELIGHCTQAQAVAVSTVTALDEVVACAAPAPGSHAALDAAYAVGQAREEAYLLAQIVRLGRMNAEERITGLLLELLHRLDEAGLVRDGGFDAPLTQEMLADVTGLTPVHVNRTLQVLRRRGDIEWKSHRVRIADPDALAERIGFVARRVTAE